MGTAMHTLPETMFSTEVPVLHLVNRFWIGGAERQFVERLRRHPEGFRAVVGCLELSGPMLEPVRAMGYEPEVFPLKGSMLQSNTAVQIARMAALIRAEGIRIVHATDFNTNLLGLAAARLAGAKAIVSRLDLGHLRAGFGRWHRRAEMLNSRLADLVVANAEAVREVCIREEGVRPENCVVVRNGIDLEHFDDLAARGLPGGVPLLERGRPLERVDGGDGVPAADRRDAGRWKSRAGARGRKRLSRSIWRRAGAGGGDRRAAFRAGASTRNGSARPPPRRVRAIDGEDGGRAWCTLSPRAGRSASRPGAPAAGRVRAA